MLLLHCKIMINYFLIVYLLIHFYLFICYLGHANALKILYSSTKNPGSTKKASRHIPQAPERILDAPEILDDYCKQNKFILYTFIS